MKQPKMTWKDLLDQIGGSDGSGDPGDSGSSDGSGGSGGSGDKRSGGGKSQGPQWSLDVDQVSDNARRMFRRLFKIFLIALIPILLVCYWWFHPALNVQSSDAWMFVAIFVLLPCFCFFYYRYQAYRRGTARYSKSAAKAKFNKRLALIPLAVVVVGILGAVVSSVIFPGNAERYAAVLTPETSEFTSDIKQVNYEEIPVIDRASAVILGNRVMGAIPEYVSQFEVSPLYSQINYRGHPVRVSPLLYADFFKWFTNNANGLPAYVLVDMTTQNTEIVRLDEPIRYSESEPFERNIDRHAQLSYPFYIFGEKAFEIDDDGHPWWICPVQMRTVGLFGATTISRVVMVDAVTGATQDLDISEVPQWVDRAFPADLLVEQYNWYGSYKNGWLNSILGQEGVVQTTPGTDGTLGYNYIAKDDDVWVYTGVTSAVSDNSIVGFVLINQRTAESHYYAIAGATEASAMSSAEGQVQNLKYRATFPLLLNINSQPTYFMALKDDAGLVKKYAMLDIQRYQNVAVGDTLAQCEQSYKALLLTNGIEVEGPVEGELLQTSGVVARIATAVIDGNSHYYLKLEGDDLIYDCALPAVFEVLNVDVGSTVSLGYRELGSVGVVENLKL
ncbi:MAG: Tat pathway signal sequence [Coriobacteriales bacterium]|jgi:hypothetical protein|nr:Tat pathway signal sequence [Coriobacteriales bacterium]